MIGIQKNRISRFDLKIRCGEGSFKVGRLNQLQQTFLRQIQTDAFGIEHCQRHRVDRPPTVLAGHVIDRIDVRAGVLAQVQAVHSGRHDFAVRDAVPLLMSGVDGDRDFGKAGKDGHAREDLLAQVDDFRHAALYIRPDIGIQDMHSKPSLHFRPSPSFVDLSDKLVQRLIVLEGTRLFKNVRLAVDRLAQFLFAALVHPAVETLAPPLFADFAQSFFKPFAKPLFEALPLGQTECSAGVLLGHLDAFVDIELAVAETRQPCDLQRFTVRCLRQGRRHHPEVLRLAEEVGPTLDISLRLVAGRILRQLQEDILHPGKPGDTTLLHSHPPAAEHRHRLAARVRRLGPEREFADRHPHHTVETGKGLDGAQLGVGLRGIDDQPFLETPAAWRHLNAERGGPTFAPTCRRAPPVNAEKEPGGIEGRRGALARAGVGGDLAEREPWQRERPPAAKVALRFSTCSDAEGYGKLESVEQIGHGDHHEDQSGSLGSRSSEANPRRSLAPPRAPYREP